MIKIIKRGDTIILNDVEMQTVRIWVDLMLTKKPELRLQHENKNESVELSFLRGYAGELAFCKMANLYPQLHAEKETLPHDCGEKGWFIDVKTVPYHYQKLDCNEKYKDKPIDYYVMMKATGPRVLHEFIFLGYCSWGELFTKENYVSYADITPGGKGYGYMKPHWELRKELTLNFTKE